MEFQAMNQGGTIPGEWTEALDRIQRQLEHILGDLVEPPAPPEIGDSGEAQSREIRERLRQRLDKLDAHAALAQEQAARLDKELEQEIQALQTWLRAAAQVKEQVAQMTSRAIS
jgi:hypothetical protein